MSELKLAFLLPSSPGHANTHLAISRYLMNHLPAGVSRVEIHIIADSDGEKLCNIANIHSQHGSYTFHAMSQTSIFGEAFGGLDWLKRPPPSIWRPSSLKTYNNAASLVFPPPAAYLERYAKISEILETLKPDLFVVDWLFRTLGVDAAKQAGIQYCVLSPCPSLQDAQMFQPQGRGLWYYPAIDTTIRFPVPWSSMLTNILTTIAIVLVVALSPSRRALDAARKAAGLTGSVLAPLNEGARGILYASSAEIEYPHRPVKGTIFCGPIVNDCETVTVKQFPEITNFLNQQRTVLINLGSNFEFSGDEFDAVLAGITIARERLSNQGQKGFQVLWKLPKSEDFDSALASVDGLLVKKWIEPDTLAVLKHPNLVAHVHHGGANTLIEDALAAVPQIHLPMWFDLYPLATRTEWLGHGIYANRGVEPGIEGSLLADALVRILDDAPGSEGHRIQTKATEIAEMLQRTGGARVAAEAVVNLALGRDEKVKFHAPTL